MFSKNIVSSTLAIAILIVCIDQGDIFLRAEIDSIPNYFCVLNFGTSGCFVFVWFVFGLSFLLVVISLVGSAIRCWNCNSRFNSGCADTFNNATIGYLTECLPTISLPNIQTVTQCRKIKHKGKQSALPNYKKRKITNVWLFPISRSLSLRKQ